MLQANAGQSSQELHAAMNKMLMRLNTSPNVMMAFGSFETGTPELYLDIDRAKAEQLDVPVDRIFAALQGNVAAGYINDFNLHGYSFKVKMQSEDAARSDYSELMQITVRSNRGKMVPLSAFAKVKRTVGSRSLTRFNQLLSAKITVQSKPGVSSQTMMKHIEKIMEDSFPKGYQISWTDMSYQERGNEGKIMYLLLLALVFGYLFLVGQYESWTMPISVVLSFFFAMLGGFWGMKLCGLDFSIYAQLGIVMLIGLACKNAILMVEFAKQEREAGKSVEEAAQSGFSHRYRAVLMTAWSFVIGVFPMVIATGAGAGSRQAIGITTFYGMLLSTIVGIVFIPPLYAFFQRSREWVYNKLGITGAKPE
jgi:multidrug efflux pump subunit AcrB